MRDGWASAGAERRERPGLGAVQAQPVCGVRSGRRAADVLRAEVSGRMARRTRLPRSLGAAGGEPIRHHRALAGAEPGGSAGGERPELWSGRRSFLWTPAPSGAGGDACVGGAFRTPPDLLVRVAGGGDL